MKILFLTDLHFKESKHELVDKFITNIKNILDQTKFDIIVLGGDFLHYHSRIQTNSLNYCYKLIEILCNKSLVFILVGNHDYINNQQFLSQNHWLNGLKKWKNCNIIDFTTQIKLENKYFITLVPYVPPGKFREALDFVDWKRSKIIFAHQEIKGCSMGVIKSINGDVWKKKYPFLISGHIHDKQMLNNNVLYPGDSFNNKSLVLDLDENGDFKISFIKIISVKKKVILKKNVKSLLSEDFQDCKMENTRIICEDILDEIMSFKKTQIYSKLKNIIKFIPLKNNENHDIDLIKFDTFEKILEEKINSHKDKDKLISMLDKLSKVN